MTDQPALRDHTVAVIGATGRLGHRIVRDLRAAGARVIQISRHMADPSGAAVDGLDTGALAVALSGASAVINAGPAQLASSIAAARPPGVPLVAVGSLRRLLPPGHAGREEAITADTAIRQAGGVILHPALLYGDGADPMTRWLSRWPVVPAPGRLIQPLHLDDAAACFLAALTRWPVGSPSIDVVGPAPITQWQAYRQIAAGRLLLPAPLMLLRPLARWLPEIERQAYDQVADPGPMQVHLGLTARPFTP